MKLLRFVTIHARLCECTPVLVDRPLKERWGSVHLLDSFEMSSTSVFNHGSQHAPKRSATDSNLRVLRRSVRKIINGFRADRVEGIFEGIDELRLLTDWSPSSEKNGRKNSHTKTRRSECIEPVSHQEKQKSVTRRAVHNLGGPTYFRNPFDLKGAIGVESYRDSPNHWSGRSTPGQKVHSHLKT